MRWLKAADRAHRQVPTFGAIGRVRGAPKRPPADGWSRVDSRIEIEPDVAPALDGIGEYSHVIVVFAMDAVGEDARAALKQAPPGAPAPIGVLALRTQARPNPIGVAVVRLHRVEGATLFVRGLDAIEGTPVLDIKPYIPYYDSVPDATVAGWIGHP